MESLAETHTENSCVTAVALRGGGSDPHGAGTGASSSWAPFGLSHQFLSALLSLFSWGSWYEGSNLCVNPGAAAKLAGCCTDPEGYDYFSIHNANTLRILIVSPNVLLEVTAKQRCQYHSLTEATRNVTVCSFFSVLCLLTSTKRSILRTNCLS